MPDTEAAVERCWQIIDRYLGDTWPQEGNERRTKIREAIEKELAAAQRDGYVRALEAVPCALPEWANIPKGDCLVATTRVVDYGPGGERLYDMEPKYRCHRCKLLAEAREATDG